MLKRKSKLAGMSVPSISRLVLRLFRRIVRGYLRRHFHGVRVSGAERFVKGAEPLIVYANHGSWWDPMVSIMLAERLMLEQDHFAPMDATALARYGILKRLGIFPVEMKSARGAMQFLRTGEAVLKSGGVLWVTPQGRFVDARERPLKFLPGLAAIAVRVAPCAVLPLAIEYPFWDERLPECLLRFGTVMRVSVGESAENVEARLIAALETTMDALQEMALRRDAREFALVLGGAAGVGGFYALGEQLKGLVAGKPYRAEHTSVPPGAAAMERSAELSGAKDA